MVASPARSTRTNRIEVATGALDDERVVITLVVLAEEATVIQVSEVHHLTCGLVEC